VDRWLDEAAKELSLEPLDGGEVATVLRLARDVAHGVERRAAPLAAYLAGLAAGRALGGGEPGRPGNPGGPETPRRSALDEIARTLTARIPASAPDEPGPGGG
jgi:hypothetical protein